MRISVIVDQPDVVSREAWLAAHEIFLPKEKELTKRSDELAAERRRLLCAKVTRTYTFDAASGHVSLADLFDGRHQRVVYHHMLKPNDPSPFEDVERLAIRFRILPIFMSLALFRKSLGNTPIKPVRLREGVRPSGELYDDREK